MKVGKETKNTFVVCYGGKKMKDRREVRFLTFPSAAEYFHEKEADGKYADLFVESVETSVIKLS